MRSLDKQVAKVLGDGIRYVNRVSFSAEEARSTSLLFPHHVVPSLECRKVAGVSLIKFTSDLTTVLDSSIPQEKSPHAAIPHWVFE